MLKFKPSIRTGKKEDLSDWTWNGCWCRRTGLSISQTADLLGFSHTTISSVYREWSEKEKISSERQLCGWKCLVDVRGQRRMDRLVRDDRKTTVTLITTRYNQDLQNTISEHTTHQTLKQMSSSSRRPHRVPLLSDKTSTRRIQFTQNHQNWTIEDWKTLPGLMSLYFCERIWWIWWVRIWRKGHESMDPSCLVSTVQAGGGGVMVWGILSCHTLGPLVPIEHRLNTTVYLSIVADHVHLFMTTEYTSSDDYFQQDNAPCHKARIISDWFLEHDNEFTLLKWPPQSPDLNPIEHLWDVEERENHIMDLQPTNLQQLRDAIMTIWPKSLRNVSNTLLNLCHEELRQFEGKRGPTRY